MPRREGRKEGVKEEREGQAPVSRCPGLKVGHLFLPGKGFESRCSIDVQTKPSSKARNKTECWKPVRNPHRAALTHQTDIN